MSEEVSYIFGNKHNPVMILGDDPGNSPEDVRDDSGAVIKKAQDNVLVAHFARVESVPRDTVYPEETATDSSTGSDGA